MATKKLSDSGLPREMPLAPGNAKAGIPADSRVTAAEDEIPWLAKSKQKWTQDRINAIDQRRKARAGVHQVGESQLTDIPWYRVLDEKRR